MYVSLLQDPVPGILVDGGSPDGDYPRSAAAEGTSQAYAEADCHPAAQFDAWTADRNCDGSSCRAALHADTSYDALHLDCR